MKLDFVDCTIAEVYTLTGTEESVNIMKVYDTWYYQTPEGYAAADRKGVELIEELLISGVLH